MQAKTGAGAAIAERSKDAKKTFGKAAPKTVKPAAASKPAKAAEGEGRRRQAFHGHARHAQGQEHRSGAVAMAASVIGKGSKPAKAKSK